MGSIDAIVNGAPGVIVEEQPGTPPIVGVGTSTAGFIGLIAGTPDDDNLPEPVTTFAEFQEKFATGSDAESQVLVRAIRGFFLNGGRRCYVIPVSRLSKVTPAPAGEGEDLVVEALSKFEAIDDISLVAVPVPVNTIGTDAGANQARRAEIRELLRIHCGVTMTNRFAILDGEPLQRSAATPVPTPEKVYPDAAASAYAAIYFPWLELGSPGAESTPQPPSGHVAGVFARVDGSRGVFKAPANEFIVGAPRLLFPVTKAHQADLNRKNINAIRNLDGGIKVFGARTLSETADLRYVSVRRYLIFLRESIEKSTQFVVWEPNDRGLWQRIIRTIGGFLFTQWSEGALFGDTPKQAFFVKCDESTNTPQTISQGLVITEIGVAIVKPAEFVVFRLSQLTQ